MTNAIKVIENPETAVKTEERLITLTEEDVHNLLLIGNKAALLGGYYLVYPSTLELYEALRSLACDDTDETFTAWVEIATDPPVSLSNLVNAKTVKDAFLEAEHTDFWEFSQDCNMPMRMMRISDANVMSREIAGLWDALYYAIIDNIHGRAAESIRTLDADNVYEYFVSSLGYWWVIDYCGLSEALDLLKDFFNHYYPLLQSRISSNVA